MRHGRVLERVHILKGYEGGGREKGERRGRWRGRKGENEIREEGNHKRWKEKEDEMVMI